MHTHPLIQSLAEVAGLLWQKNWAECNGGNISLRIDSDSLPEGFSALNGWTDYPLAEACPALDDQYLLISASGSRMRELARDPLGGSVILHIQQQGKKARLWADSGQRPSSELPSHLAIHAFLAGHRPESRAVLHTHPCELISLSHHPGYQSAQRITTALWAMMPETRVLVPRGLGYLPYMLPGSRQLAAATVAQLARFDVLVWAMHGVVASAPDLIRAFDMIDALNKSARIRLLAMAAGYEPQGLSPAQLDELALAFDIEWPHTDVWPSPGEMPQPAEMPQPGSKAPAKPIKTQTARL